MLVFSYSPFSPIPKLFENQNTTVKFKWKSKRKKNTNQYTKSIVLLIWTQDVNENCVGCVQQDDESGNRHIQHSKSNTVSYCLVYASKTKFNRTLEYIYISLFFLQCRSVAVIAILLSCLPFYFIFFIFFRCIFRLLCCSCFVLFSSFLHIFFSLMCVCDAENRFQFLCRCSSILNLMCVCFELISIHENDAHSCEMVVHLLAVSSGSAAIVVVADIDADATINRLDSLIQKSRTMNIHFSFIRVRSLFFMCVSNIFHQFDLQHYIFFSSLEHSAF